MRTAFSFLFVIGLTMTAPLFAQKQPAAAPEGHHYVIGPGDVLQIQVLKEPDASVPSVVVRPDGQITLPLIKDLSVAGMTPTELQQLLTSKLSAVIREPDVTVIVREIHSEKVSVIGQVRKEGPIVLQGPMTVLQAIGEAGGLGDYAKKSKIYILRQEHGKQVRMPFDYNAVVRGQHPEQNVTLLPGDSVVVP